MEELLDGAEVEWVALEEASEIARGKRVVKSQLNETGNYAVYQNSMTPLGYFSESNVNSGTTFIVCAGAAGEIGYSDSDFWAADDVYYFPSNQILDSKYLYHFLLTQKHKIQSRVRRASIPRLSRTGFAKIQIPIPCPDNPEKSLTIQAEIVRILDRFIELTAELTVELTVELTARKKQHNHYRDLLLSFEEAEVEWRTLGEVGTWYGGGTPTKSHRDFWDNGTIPWLSPKDMGSPTIYFTEDYITEEAVARSSTKLVPENSVAMVVRSSILDKRFPSALIPLPVTLNQDMKAVVPDDDAVPKYIAHLVSSRGDEILRAARKTGGSVASIDSKKLFSYRVPIPDIDEQKRLVGILDKFETLVHSISEGLQHEIELRHKQYEYYRGLLLSFPTQEAQSEALP